MRERLSVALIAKNAALHLSECLQSVAWADEIVVLDGHSTDRTREIARSFGAKVIEKDFESFPAERAYVLQHTSYDWVLALDADMIVPPALGEEIRALLARGPTHDAYRMRCLNHFLGREIRHCSWFDYRFLRLFDKRKGTYNLGLKIYDPFISTGSVGKLKHHLIHHQTETLERYLQKMVHLFARFTADEYADKGVQIRWWTMPWYFALKPAAVFFYKYVIRGGFLDGIPGLIICLNSAILYYFIFSILWDRQRGVPDYRLERYLPRTSSAPTGEVESRPSHSKETGQVPR
jgi:glycosyltransferase involved in cell wall biosynthesis